MILGIRQQFVQPILDGTKIHTLRPLRSKPIKVGTKLQFTTDSRFKKGKRNIVAEFEVPENRLITAMPYHHCCVDMVCIHFGATIFAKDYTTDRDLWKTDDDCFETFDQLDELARNDGFEDYDKMESFLIKLYKLHKHIGDELVFQLLLFQQPKDGVLPSYLKGANP